MTGPPGRRSAGPLLAVTLGVALLAGLAYRGALDAGWVWDDRLVVTQQLPRFHGIGDAFFPPSDVPRLVPQYYRPLIIASWLFDEARVRRGAGGQAPRGALQPESDDALDVARRRAFHQTNVLIHASNAALVVLLSVCVVGSVAGGGPARLAAAGGAGLLFALHPIAVEPVTRAAGRSDLMMAFFLLSAFLVFWRGVARDSLPLLVLSGGLLLSALLCKESALGAVPVFPFLAASARPEGTARSGSARSWVLVAPFAAALTVYATLRIVAAGPAAAPPLAMTVGGIADALATLGWYVMRVVWPVPMAVFVTEVFSLPRAVLGAALLVGVGIAAALGRRRGGGWVPIATGAILFLGPLLPTLVAFIGEFAPVVAAERYLYLPLAGCGLVCATGLALLVGRWPASSVAPGAALAAAALFLGPAWRTTQARIGIWADEERLWSLAVEQAPNALLPHVNLALAYDRAGRADQALAEYARAVSAKGSDRGRALALSHYGAALLAQDRLAEAVAALSGSVALDPRAARTQYNLAHALVRQAERETDPASRGNLLHAALPHLEAALESEPGHTLARFQYGDVLAQLGQVDAGIAALEEGLARSPGHPRAVQARRSLERLKSAPPSAPPPGAADR